MATQVQPGAVLAGTYEVERLLGEGGMGVVVAARHLGRDQVVALKFMLPMALSFPQAVERFLREAKVLSVLRSEHLAAVLDVGVLDNGAPYFAMEYLDGLDLGKLIRQYGALAVADAVDFVLQACEGVAKAHEHGVVHRDLKPSNLLLAQRDDGGPLIKVLDFGLSKILSDSDEDSLPASTQTQTTGTMGTPAYMSPEQARSAKNVDLRSDIWSLGAILYHLLSARLPFPAQATAEAFAKLLYEEPVPLRDSAPWTPVALEGVIVKCLQKDADRRYQSVTELIEDLRPFRGAERAGTDSAGVRHGPKQLDVGAVLQQRTLAAFEPLSLAFAGTLAQGQVALPPPRKRPLQRGRLALMAALGGILMGGGVIIGAALFAGRDASSARPASTAETISDTAPARPPPDPLMNAPGEPPMGTATGTATAPPAEPAADSPASGSPASGSPASGSPAAEAAAEPASATDAGLDAAARTGNAAETTPGLPATRSDRQPDKPRGDRLPKKKPPPRPDELDPFGTIH